MTTESMPPYRVLLYYLYTEIDDPENFAREHRALCESLGLLGRIIVAREGINGTVSGERAATEAYQKHMVADPRFASMVFKIDPATEHTFPKLSVKARDEIVSLKLEEDLNPNEMTGKRLAPAEFYQYLQSEDEEVVVLDARNDYESDLGKFRGALCPPLAHFRDFPQWVRENLADQKDKTILTYCTGGIRCEKFSGFLVQEGFENVYQLDGGIVTYGRDPEVQGRGFEGKCYVFDQRIAVEVNRTVESKVISKCRHCGDPCDHYVNCQWAPCNAQFFCCESCLESEGQYCQSSCKESALLVASRD